MTEQSQIPTCPRCNSHLLFFMHPWQKIPQTTIITAQNGTAPTMWTKAACQCPECRIEAISPILEDANEAIRSAGDAYMYEVGRYMQTARSKREKKIVSIAERVAQRVTGKPEGGKS